MNIGVWLNGVNEECNFESENYTLFDGHLRMNDLGIEMINISLFICTKDVIMINITDDTFIKWNGKYHMHNINEIVKVMELEGMFDE